MYFASNQVNNLLNCKKCEGRLDEPRILPCGNSICSHCVSSIQLKENKEFQCLICNELHEMPQKGLLISKVLVELLSFESINVSRGKAFDSLQQIMIDIQKKQYLFKYRLYNSTDYLKELFIDLRNEVQLATEQFHEKIDAINKELIDEIDEYESELIDSNKNSNLDLELLKNFQDFAHELESFQLETDDYLKQHSLNDEKINNLYIDAINLKEKTESKIENLDSLILHGYLLEFKPNKEKLDKKLSGQLIRKDLNEILVENRFEELISICEFSKDQKWNLIYKGSKDGFKASDFHSKCDDKSNTLVIVKSSNGNVFGGYTEQSWSNTDPIRIDKPDSNAFIFSLINMELRPLKIKCSPYNGIRCYNSYGPVFGGEGGNSDLEIGNNSDLKLDGFSYFGHYYIHPDYKYKSVRACSFLAGSKKFQVSEIEVYTHK